MQGNDVARHYFSVLICKLNNASDKQEASSEAFGASFPSPLLHTKPGTVKLSGNRVFTAKEDNLFAHFLA